jgi:catechol 2,3-dioxygenase-like lactoylglutathione lyase family enzyme
MPTNEAATAVGFEGMNPILRVENLAASIEYYIAKLGFKVDWQTPIFAAVSRGKCHIFLSEGDQGHPGAWVWIGVEDAEALHNEYRAAGARIRHPPTNYEWAYEMQVEDLDGNVLRMGSDQKNDQPVGEWLDMEGERWAPVADGKWAKVGK